MSGRGADAPAPTPAPPMALAQPEASTALRLIPPLPKGPFVAEPEEIDRFVVRVLPDGSLYFKGSRERIDTFLATCAKLGLEVRVNSIALCG